MSNGSEVSASPERVSISVLYGSETGTAQDVAETLGRELRRRHFGARVIAMDEYDRDELLDEQLVIFICSTTGQGQEPANMRSFWRFLLRSDLPSDLLEDIQIAVFGLGDSTYAKYNWVAKRLHRRLADLGASSLVERGEGDEQDYLGIETALAPWQDELFEALDRLCPSSTPIISADQRPPSRLVLRETSVKGKEKASLPLGSQWATVASNERVTAADHFQDTRLLELRFDEPVECVSILRLTHARSYEPGDIAELRPHNPTADVEEVLHRLGWPADESFEMSTRSSEQPLPRHWPSILTPRELLTRHLDILSVPRRSFFERLAHFTTDEQETEKLREFCSPDGQDDRYDYANRPRRTIAEVLSEFRSARVPLEYIADLFPELRPRQFSIASHPGPEGRSDSIELLVAIVRYQTQLKVPRKGVGTAWIAGLKEGDRIPVTMLKGSLTPPTADEPVILIGPGTGIAPLRSISLGRKRDTLVFCGCRNEAKDWYFKDEWMSSMARQESIAHIAASRDQPHKVYVQHEIREHADDVWAFLHRPNARVYISGSAGKMPTAVRDTLKSVCVSHGGMDEMAADRFMAQLDREGRLLEETW